MVAAMTTSAGDIFIFLLLLLHGTESAVVGAVMDCEVGEVDGTIPHAPTDRIVELAERYGIAASTKRVVDALAARASVPSDR